MRLVQCARCRAQSKRVRRERGGRRVRSRRVVATVLIGAWLASSAVMAQPGDVAALRAELARVEGVVRDAGADEAARVAAAREAHELRAKLIALAPQSLDAPTWLADQAADALARAMAGHDDLSVLAGVATEAERARVRSAAEDAAGLLTRARETGERLVERLEADLFKEDVDEARVAAIERALAKLIDEELEARVPLLSARASVLLAASAPAGEEGAAEARDAARRVLEALSELRFRTEEAEAERLALTGSALLAAAGGDLQMRSRAREMFRAAAAKAGIGSGGGSSEGNHGSESRATLRAHVQLGLLRTGGADPARLAVEREALLEQGRALIASWAGSELEGVIREGVCAEMLARDSKNSAWVGQALGLLAEGVEFADGQAGAAARDAGAKIAAALERGALSVEALPRKAALAAALALEGRDDVATHGERIRLLRAAAREAGDGGDNDGSVRAEALWRLAAVLADSERTAELIEGAAALGEVVRLGHANPARFASAVDAGPELARFAVARAAAGKDAEQVERARQVLARVLFAVVRSDEAGVVMGRESIRAARLELVRLLLAETAGEGMSGRDRASVLEEAVWVLEGVGEAAGQSPESGQDQDASALMARAMVLARGVAVDARVGLTGRAAAWAETTAAPERAWLRLEHSRALLAGGDGREALRAIAPLRELQWGEGGQAGVSVAEVRLTVARAQRAAGDAAGAFATLRELTGALDQPVTVEAGDEPGGARHPIFWEAWAEMLEMLAAENEGGERTAEIRLQLRRLELIDEGLGGGAAAERIRAVGAGLGG